MTYNNKTTKMDDLLQL